MGLSRFPEVDKIVGPGNIYVATAKRLVFGEVSIDSIAGPSEILIISDGSGDPAFLPRIFSPRPSMMNRRRPSCCARTRNLPKRFGRKFLPSWEGCLAETIAEHSLRDFGAILIVKSLAEAVKVSNELAPEHLELAVKEPWALLDKIENAGAIFLGHLSPEAIGDYVAGPNHVLPTGGTARFSSPLGVYDFMKRSSLICLSAAGLKNLSPAAMRMASMERLEGHRRSVEKRQVGSQRRR